MTEPFIPHSFPHMELAILLANRALQRGDVPVGAVVVREGVVVGSGWNQREDCHKVTGHAELMALEDACRQLGSWRLDGCDLFVTLEPCTMCASAIIQARIRSVYFGAWDPKAGAAGSVMNLFEEPWINHRVTVYEGIMEQPCRALLEAFFGRLRQRMED